MADLNRVFLIGRLTRDPELRHLPNGTPATDLGLAVNRQFSTRDGERREEVLFVDVNVLGRQAETCCQYLRKGRPIHVEGYLRMDTWTDKATGENRSKIKVAADRVQFLDSRDARGGEIGDDEESSTSTRGRAAASGGGRTSAGPSSGGSSRSLDAPPQDAGDDIPF